MFQSFFESMLQNTSSKMTTEDEKTTLIELFSMENV